MALKLYRNWGRPIAQMLIVVVTMNILGGSLIADDTSVVLGHLVCNERSGPDESVPDPSGILEILCSYQRSDSGIVELYTGTLHALGQPDAMRKRNVMLWVVRGPRSAVGLGMLAQTYAPNRQFSDDTGVFLSGFLSGIDLMLLTPPEGTASMREPLVDFLQLDLHTAPA